MFTTAYAIASAFTRPVVISSRTVKGDCSAAIGAYVALNADGWIVTAAHLIAMIQQQERAARTYRKYQQDVRQMNEDVTSGRPHRVNKLRRFKRPTDASVRDHSTWWGVDGARMTVAHIAPAADIAVARLQPFDPDSIANYPVFKTPGPDVAPGRSLCRLGFAFHNITPSYDEERKAFVLPPGSVPLPLFPLEGMLTRVVRTQAPNAPKGTTCKFIETSTPGVVGQSGGPLFDTGGNVWGIQSHTRHYPLGFSPPAPGGRAGQVEHQFHNAGMAVHNEMILAVLQQHDVAHQRTS